jgi:hypothetical protein
MRFLYGFLNHREGGMVFCQVFLISPLQYRNCNRLSEFEEIDISSKDVERTLNTKEENPYDFCLDFVQEFHLSRCLTFFTYLG